MQTHTQTPEQEMSTLDAIMLIEGGECDDEEELLKAWQLLHDTGLGYKLQGFYGRTLHSLLEQGLIS